MSSTAVAEQLRTFLASLTTELPSTLAITPAVFDATGQLMLYMELATNPHLGRISVFADGDHHYVATIHNGTVGIYDPRFRRAAAAPRATRSRLHSGFVLDYYPALQRVYEFLERRGYAFDGPWVWMGVGDGKGTLPECTHWLRTNIPAHTDMSVQRDPKTGKAVGRFPMMGWNYSWMFGKWEHIPGWEKVYIQTVA